MLINTANKHPVIVLSALVTDFIKVLVTAISAKNHGKFPENKKAFAYVTLKVTVFGKNGHLTFLSYQSALQVSVEKTN